jgi:CspA family cold shock protein
MPLLFVRGSAQGGHYWAVIVAACAACGGRHDVSRNVNELSEGKIKRLTDRGFGFIDTGDGNDMFFHMSAVEGTTFDQLHEGQRVSFNPGQGPKGPRAENVRPI